MRLETEPRLLTALCAIGALSLACLAVPVSAQNGQNGYNVVLHATNVSTRPSGLVEAIVADPGTGGLVYRSQRLPSGLDIEVGMISPTGAASVLTWDPDQRSSHRSGAIMDPAGGGLIYAEEDLFNDIVLLDLIPNGFPNTLFPLPWILNSEANGTGQHHYAVDPAAPDLLFFWDNQVAKLFKLTRSSQTLEELFAADQGTTDGFHFTTRYNDLVFDPATPSLILSDGCSNSLIELDHATVPATVLDTLFQGLGPYPGPIDFLPSEAALFIAVGDNDIYKGPRGGGNLVRIATGFNTVRDIALQQGNQGGGTSLYVADDNSVYEVYYDGVTGIEDGTPPEIAVKVSAYPNPSAHNFTIVVRSERRTNGRMQLVDARGRIVRVLSTRAVEGRTTTFAWDGTDAQGGPVPAGVYFAVFTTNGGSTARKLTLVR